MRAAVAVLLVGLSLVACPLARAQTIVPFDGVIDLRKEHLALRFGSGDTNAVVLDLQRLSPERVVFSLDLRHVKLPIGDLATEIEGDLRLTGTNPTQREASGKIKSRYTLVNHKPLRDLYLEFAIRDQKLIIGRAWVGALTGSGQIDLSGAHRSNLSFEVVSSDLEQLASLIQNGSAIHVPTLSGVMTGALTLTGPLLTPYVKGRLAAYNGCFKTLCYDSIELQLEGGFPNIRLDDSVVTHADGFSSNIAGAIDLSDLLHLPAQVRQLKKIPIVSAERDKREWVFKRLRSSETKDSVTEMKYLWLKDDRGDAEGVLGFEKKIGF